MTKLIEAIKEFPWGLVLLVLSALVVVWLIGEGVKWLIKKINK